MNEDAGLQKLSRVLLAVAVLILVLNSFSLSGMSKMAGSGSSSAEAVTGGAVTQQASSSMVPTGVPKIYGKELGISYDDVSPNDQRKADATIKTLGNLDITITLEGADLERYIGILYKMNNGISCEYCCGARAVIFADGQPACGCAHSYAMRGLTKYLITKHGDEFSDAEIQEEAAKWKFLFFPGQMEAKAQILQSKGVELNYAVIGSNAYRGIEKGAAAGGGMVGGC